MNHKPEPNRVTPISKKSQPSLSLSIDQVEEIADHASRVFDNARAFRVLNTLIVKDRPINPGVARLLELLVNDLEDVADELDNWVQL